MTIPHLQGRFGKPNTSRSNSDMSKTDQMRSRIDALETIREEQNETIDALQSEVERLRGACSDLRDWAEERRQNHRSHETQTVCEIILGILDEHHALDAAEESQ